MVIFFGLLAVGAALAAGTDKPVSRVEVIFIEPEKFTDMKDELMQTDRARDYLLEQLKVHMQSAAQSMSARGSISRSRYPMLTWRVDLSRGTASISTGFEF